MITLHGGIGQTVLAVFGAQAGLSAEAFYEQRWGEAMLTPETAGAAVLALVGEREAADRMLGADGLRPWLPLSAPPA